MDKNSKDFKRRLARARSKGAYTIITSLDNGNLYVEVKNNIPYNGHTRILGKYIFSSDNELIKSNTIERDYQPLTLAIADLVKHGKKHKTKTTRGYKLS